MIRLRELIERGLRHRALGPVLILLVVLALAFLVLHESGEGPVESVLVACATLAALGAVAVVLLVGARAAPARRPFAPGIAQPHRNVWAVVRPRQAYALRL